MRKPRLILAVGAIALAVGATCWLTLRGPSEPLYHGRSLTSWLDQYVNYAPGKPDPANNREPAEEAIRQIGSNAVPHLLRMVAYKDSSLKLTIVAFLAKYSPFKFNIEVADVVHARAYSGFYVLGHSAKSALPSLLKQLQRAPRSDTVSREWSPLFFIVNGIGEDSIPVYRQLLTNSNAGICVYASEALLRTNPDPESVADLVKLLKSEYPEVRITIAMQLSISRILAAIPALIDNLHDPNPRVRETAAIALGYFGRQAESSLPALYQAATDPDPEVRNNAAHAILAIKPVGIAH